MSLQTCSTCGRFYVPLGEYYVGDIVGEICPYNGRHPEITVTPQPYLFSEEMTRLHAEIDRLKAENDRLSKLVDHLTMNISLLMQPNTEDE